MPAAIAPRLWFDADHVHHLRQLRDQQEPHLTAILAWAQQEAARSGEALYPAEPGPQGSQQVVEQGLYQGAHALLALFTADPAVAADHAAQAVACYRVVNSGPIPSDLGVGARLLEGSILIDSCLPFLSADDRQWLLDCVHGLHLLIRERVTKGNPHVVNNNWWAITHGGCLLAALALDGQGSADGTVYDCQEAILWARQRLHAFCHHFGDAGLYHEGLGYQGYTMSMLYPALLADQHRGGPQVSDCFPHLARSAGSLYASVVACPPTADTPSDVRDVTVDGGDLPSLGMQLSWNDAGPGHRGGIQELAMIALAPVEQRGALRWFYDHLHGIHGDRTFAPGYSGMYLAATLYPYDCPAVPAAGHLPTWVVDNRQGLVFRRSGYEGAGDSVLGAYARATHVGGHSADDAGSLRLIALGHDWMVGGGQARGAAAYQSVVTDDSGERPKPTPCGSLFWRECTAHGAVLAMDLRKVHEAYSERHVAVDFSGQCGVAVALALLDQIDDHRSDRGWLWHWSFAPNLSAEVDGDGQGFRLLAADGAQLQARFLAHLPTAITIEDMPASKRTYANGATVHYLPRRYIRAAFAPRAGAQEPLAIYTAVTISKGPGPTLRREAGLDLLIGDQAWRRPFGVDLPADFEPGLSGGVCPYPNGRRP